MRSLPSQSLPCLAVPLALVALLPSLTRSEDSPAPDSANASWQLAFKFTPDQAVPYHDTYTSSIRLQKADKTVRILNNRESKKHYTVLSVDDMGQGLVETVIDHVKIYPRKGDDPPVKIDSSQSPDTCPADFRPLLKTIGRPIAQSRCGRSGQLVKVISVSKTWLKANPGSTQESLSRSLQKRGFLVPLPDKPVAIGDTWEEAMQARTADEVGKIHSISLKKVYTLAAVRDGQATITWKTIRLTPVTNPRLLAQLIQLISTGEILFDLQQGLVRSKTSHIDQTLVGPFGADTLMSAKTKHELVLSDAD